MNGKEKIKKHNLFLSRRIHDEKTRMEMEIEMESQGSAPEMLPKPQEALKAEAFIKRLFTTYSKS